MLTAEVIEGYRLSLAVDELYSRPEFFNLVRTIDKLWIAQHSEKRERQEAAKPKGKSPRKH